MTKRVDYEIRRKEILQQATRLFLERGYEESSIIDIAKGCGMPLTRLYQYFHDKEEIVSDLVERLVGEIHRQFRAMMRGDQNPLQKIKEVMLVLGESLAREENRLLLLLELQRSVAQEQDCLLEKMNTYSQVLQQIFDQLLTEGVARGDLQVTDVESMAFALTVLVESLVFQLALNRDFSVKEHLEEVFRFLDGLERNRC